MTSTALKGASILLGRCVPCVKQNAAKIRVSKMVFDEHLKMYFKEGHFLFAHDPEKTCKTGDIVLVRELPKKITTLITHKVERVVYKLGDVVDPMTGKSVVANKFRDEIEEEKDIYGKRETGFDYAKAPPRGRLEGTKDFTDKPTFRKYHDDGKQDPYAW